VLRLNLALSNYAFHWSFPEILADELGVFRKSGVEVYWKDVTPGRVVNKTAMYTDLLKEGTTDVYHAGEWACINRVLKSKGARIVAKSLPGEGTLNRTFALYVRGASKVSKPAELAGREVAIEEGTGAQYTAINDLEAYLPRDSIRLVQVGEPHRRLLALLRGEVESASLVGPWADIGEALGMRKVLQTHRSNPTTIVMREDASVDLLRGFFISVNEVIEMMRESPERFRDSYFRRIAKILDEMKLDIPRDRLREAVVVSQWNRWEAYSEKDFAGTYAWMVERGLATRGHSPEEVVGTYSADVFL
jgi:NitT/TauT family transport system substrate-binding protein